MPMAMAVDHRLGGGRRGAGRLRDGDEENQRSKKKEEEKVAEEAERKNRFDRFGFPFT